MDYLDIDIEKIKHLLINIDRNVESLYENGKKIPCIEKNAKQIKILVNLLKVECMDIDANDYI